MDWRSWLRGLGIDAPASPNVENIVVAGTVIVGAYAIGWFVATRLSVPLTRWLLRWTGRSEGVSTAIICATLRWVLTALLLLVAANSTALSPLALLMVATALGLAVGLLVNRLAKAFGTGTVIAATVGGMAIVATTAATLGGLRPLIAGLEGVGFTIGTRRISLLGVINFIVVAAVLFVLARIANRILIHSVGRVRGLDSGQRVLVQKLGGIAVVIVAVMLGVDLLGIDLTALTVFSGALGLAVGFGLQKTFGNLIAGLILLMDRSVKPGDVIVVGDTFGAVSKIGVRAVSVVTRDGKEHLIPNEQLMTEPVENWSYSSRNVRVHIPVGVAYSSDLALAQRLMVEAATAAARVLPEPKPSVWLKGFGDSSVDHDILVWITDPEMGVGNVQSDVLNRVWLLFKEHDIEIPFPQRDVTIRAMPPGLLGRPGDDQP